MNRSKRFKFANTETAGFLAHRYMMTNQNSNLFSLKSRVMVWYAAKETFDPQCIIPTVKHGGDSVTVWGCFTRRRIGRLHILDRTLDRLYYREILERNLLPSIENFGFSGDFTFMYDNGPKHTSALVKNWLVKQHKKILLWLSYSPDLNPVEHLWNKLRRRLQKRQSKTRQELGNLLMEEWNKTETSVLEKLADSVSSRLYECIRVKSYSTKY